MDYSKVTAENLDEYMGITELPIEVHADGTVTRADDDVYSPDLYVDVDAEGQELPDAEDALRDLAGSQGWELMTGYTGQSGYRGPIMDRAEYIGGRMAEDILSEPGVYTAVEVGISAPEDAPNREELEDDAAGWAVARKMI